MYRMESNPQEKGFHDLNTDGKMHPEPCDNRKACLKNGDLCRRASLLKRYPILVSLAVVFVVSGLGLGITAALSATSRCINHLGVDYEYPLRYDRSTIRGDAFNQTYDIVLFGDSLINYPFVYYSLADRMSAYLPDFKLVIRNYGVDSNRISGMRNRVETMLAETR